MKRKMTYMAIFAGVVLAGTTAFTMTARAGYESAEYKVLESEGNIQIREYPDLMLAATDSDMDTQGRDGSFMRLFRYISGANESDQNIAMTTPVFMKGELGKSTVSMGFVMPKNVAAGGAPGPTVDGVKIQTRKGGKFAVIRFSGTLDSKLAKKQEAKLREWMDAKGINGEAMVEAASYDPPFTPSILRRNEILIRIVEPSTEPANDSVERGETSGNGESGK